MNEIHPYILAENNWHELKNKKITTVILPWGATEPHNFHLPYGTDIFESEFIAAESASYAHSNGAKVIVLPVIPFGVNTGQLDLNLVINMNPSTQMMILNDVLSSIKNYGVKKFIILNSHGGNDFKQIIRELQPKFSSIFISQINWFKIPEAEKYFNQPGDHAGELETSIMLNIYPHLVLPLNFAGTGKEKKIKIKGINEGWAWGQREWSKISEDTGVGNPAKATKEKGKLYLDFIIKKIGEYIIELDKTENSDLYSDK